MNQREFLERCVSSVANQSFEDYEHIVVDPGSTDGSPEWIQSLSDKRVKLIRKPDNGPAQGLNNGVSEAAGEIILYINADDELAPGALATIAQQHGDHPEADVLIGNGWTIGPDDQPISFVRSDRFTPFKYSLGVGTVLQQATSFKRSLFEHGLRFNESNRYNWDTELLFEAARMGANFHHVQDSLGYFRLQPNSITMSGRHEMGLASERERLRAIGRAPLPRLVAMSFSLPARGVKKGVNILRDLVRPPEFPGVVREGI